MGPVWCYWAFPMEQYCGALGRANLKPRFPFVSLNRRVLEVAQLAQIKSIYHLFETLDLGHHKQATATGSHYPAYPHTIFVRPHRVITINTPLAKQIGTYLGNLYNVDPKVVERCIMGQKFDAWGKMQQTIKGEGLDIISGHAFLPDTETPRRDATYVKVSHSLFMCNVSCS
jgi:hypothetical protein